MKNNMFKVGDTVKVTFKPKEGAKTRITPFEGKVIAYRGTRSNKTFTVRRVMSSNVAVERIFPIDSPLIEGVQVIKKEQVRRAKLYYLRKR